MALNKIQILVIKMNKKIIAIAIVGIFLLLSSSTITGATDQNKESDEDEMFRIEILSAIYRQGRIPLEIEIYTNEKLTNVTYELAIEGFLISSLGKTEVVRSSVEGYWLSHDRPGKCIGLIGFGLAIIIARLTCDEGLEAGDTAKAFVVGNNLLLISD